MEAAAQARGVEQCVFSVAEPILDESLLGKCMMYVQNDGFHMYEVIRSLPADSTYNYEVKMLHGEGQGKLFNYLLNVSYFSSRPQAVGDWSLVEDVDVEEDA